MRGQRSSSLVVWIVCGCAVLLLVAGTVISTATARSVANRQEAQLCPKAPPGHVARNSWSRAHRVLAPSGARSVSLCRYASTRSGPGSLKLAGDNSIGSRWTIRRLISNFDALKRYHGPPFHCPKSTGDAVLADLLYRSHEVKIEVTLSGCAIASNGDIWRYAFNFNGKNPAGPRLVKQLRHLTRQFQGA